VVQTSFDVISDGSSASGITATIVAGAGNYTAVDAAAATAAAATAIAAAAAAAAQETSQRSVEAALVSLHLFQFF